MTVNVSRTIGCVAGVAVHSGGRDSNPDGLTVMDYQSAAFGNSANPRREFPDEPARRSWLGAAGRDAWMTWLSMTSLDVDLVVRVVE